MQNKMEFNEYENNIGKNYNVSNFQLMGSITFRPSEFPKKKYPKRNTSSEAKIDKSFSFLRKLINKLF